MPHKESTPDSSELVEKPVKSSTDDLKAEKKAKKNKESKSDKKKSDSPKKKEKDSSKKDSKKKKDSEASRADSEKKSESKKKDKKRKHSAVENEETSDAPEAKKPKNELALENFPLSASTVDALKSRGISELFPIQAATFQHVLNGKDVLARARTGTGKTLAFALPMIEKLRKEQEMDASSFKKRGRGPKVLVMAPTRELAGQIVKEFESVLSNSLKIVCVYGGVPYDNQVYAMKDGVDIVVGTPGRLIDHIERGNLRLDQLMFVCLDEADQMLDIGFADSMDRVLRECAEQKKRAIDAPQLQTLLFSATLPEWIKAAISKYMRKDKETVDLVGNSRMKTSENVKHYAIPSFWQNRAQVLGDIVSVYGRGNVGKTIIFVETKGEANELVLNEKLKDSQVIHGDIVQKQREISMQGFRDGKVRCLIATNVCARGVDIPEVDLVVNCEPPKDVESYIHRSGRTGRAGKAGICVTFYKPQQESMLDTITRRAGVQFIRIGAPQPAEIIAARASDTVEDLVNVHPRAMEYFSSTADELLKAFEGNSKEALKACLAMICNTTKPLPPRSLLSANEGFLTLLFKVNQPIRNVGYIKSIIQKCYPGVTYDDTRGWRMTKDCMGVVVDIVADKVDIRALDDGSQCIKLGGAEWVDGKGVSLEIAKEVPELKEKDFQGSQNQGHYNGNRSNQGPRGRYQNSQGSRGYRK